jgi:hypothetical protein
VYESYSGAEKVAKVTPMHRFQFQKWQTETHGETPEHAATMWKALVKSKAKRDKKFGKLRIHVLEEEYVLYTNGRRKANQVHGSLREKRKPKAEDMAALQANVELRQMGYDDGFFCDLAADGETVEGLAGPSVTGEDMLAGASGGGGRGRGDQGEGAAKRRKLLGTEETAGSAGQGGGAGGGSGSGSGGSAGGAAATPTPGGVKAVKDPESKRSQVRAQCLDMVTAAKAQCEELYREQEEKESIITDDEKKEADFEPLVATLRLRFAAMGLVLGSVSLRKAVPQIKDPTATEGTPLPAGVTEDLLKELESKKVGGDGGLQHGARAHGAGDAVRGLHADLAIQGARAESEDCG